MSAKQMEHVRNVDLARRLKLAMGGIPTLTLVVRGERPELEAPRARRSAEEIRAELERVYGGPR